MLCTLFETRVVTGIYHRWRAPVMIMPLTRREQSNLADRSATVSRDDKHTAFANVISEQRRRGRTENERGEDLGDMVRRESRSEWR
jgi:hypothetical protein